VSFSGYEGEMARLFMPSKGMGREQAGRGIPFAILRGYNGGKTRPFMPSEGMGRERTGPNIRVHRWIIGGMCIS